MTLSRLLARCLAGLVAAAALAQGARAEPNPAACQRYRAELANLQREANRGQVEEIQRLVAYRNSIGCEGGRFLFFDMRPPQCAQVEQRIRALNSGYGAGNTQVADARRAQLVAAVKDACTGLPATPKAAEGYARGGGQVICVRMCDGAYFPMPNLPDGREGANEMCKALCPGTEAAAYSMPATDNGLQQAAAIQTRRAYAALPNAFKFQKAFVPNCSCRGQGQSWAEALVKAESMLVRHKGDIFVTPAQAEALSRPKVRLTLVGRADRSAATLAATAAARNGLEEPPGTEAPVAPARPAGPDEKPPVRIIAPTIIPVPVPVRSEGPQAAAPVTPAPGAAPLATP
ncbi:DUF2865 domain-containing protein [Methylobacterium nodulans]|uniref:DUF2865 domain-containing protein n=1 Tax=Methylobacterium nodulans (strain LMG 21967 / CNCM I-2342 / ORS 2060) TaxID=460265 RepID=B8IPY1_METNO|nr:DUF2865 domain-containing protein [Methylobacterium nodulans]ACL56631.1 conserved hypothetical protein [Methylobacterium nodulans ORS 2060]